MEDFVERLKSNITSSMYKGNKMVSECEELCREFPVETILVANGINNISDISETYSEYSSYDVVDWDTPRLGDRIPYIVTRGNGDINGRVENPEYVSKMDNIKTDTLYYISNQLKNPLTDLMKLFIDKEKLDIFSDYERRALNSNNNVREITSFFSPIKKTKLNWINY